MSQRKNKKELEALIMSVKNGDQKAFAALLQQYSPLIEASVNAFCSDGASTNDRDDFRQEASIAFYKSVLSYDLEQSDVELGLYAKICIFHALTSQARIAKRTPSDTQEFLDNHVPRELCEDPSSKLLEEERLGLILRIIHQALSKYEYKIWELYLSGYSPSEIAKLLNTDSKSVSNAIYRIRVKLKKSLNNRSE